ncbi:hypothetical protein FA95DRAFT_1197490 [Auriscalpium vulgare]|uniref:Uncharacterized protein n=1 Tax=Auriscalpium vulgare TaxID=40419 RepID=A0ACB8RUJ5_9AGAM|nr:hypothetical protein FA95DRAFT_1197490 [Auriscalpium vulgare]
MCSQKTGLVALDCQSQPAMDPLLCLLALTISCSSPTTEDCRAVQTSVFLGIRREPECQRAVLEAVVTAPPPQVMRSTVRLYPDAGTVSSYASKYNIGYCRRTFPRRFSHRIGSRFSSRTGELQSSYSQVFIAFNGLRHRHVAISYSRKSYRPKLSHIIPTGAKGSDPISQHATWDVYLY